jgi:hypothetical protein
LERIYLSNIRFQRDHILWVKVNFCCVVVCLIVHDVFHRF